MSQTQITAGLGLLKKVLPDLASQDINANLNHSAADPLMELLQNIASNGKRAGKG